MRKFNSFRGTLSASTADGLFLFFTVLLGGVGRGPGCTKGGRKGTQSLYKNEVACATAVIMGDTVAAFGGGG